VQCVPRTLAHILNAAKKSDGRGWGTQIDSPDPVREGLLQAPIVMDGLLQKEGLYDVHTPSMEIAWPCVFKLSGWARGLSARELLHVYDTPSTLIQPILEGSHLPLSAIAHSLSPRVVTSLFYTIWSDNYGGGLERSPSESSVNEVGERLLLAV
jgi:hypothetical protein